MFDYIKTNEADVERLIKARDNINKGVYISVFFFIILYGCTIITAFILKAHNAVLYALLLAVVFLVMTVGLMIKREIFSMMIYLKGLEEHIKWK